MGIQFGMDEYEFINAIDALFFYDSNGEYETVTRIGCFMSDDAAFMVGYELASLSSHAPLEINLKLLQIMKEERPSEIVMAAIPVIERLIRKQKTDKTLINQLFNVCRQLDIFHETPRLLTNGNPIKQSR